jgi:hypothetical protein
MQLKLLIGPKLLKAQNILSFGAFSQSFLENKLILRTESRAKNYKNLAKTLISHQLNFFLPAESRKVKMNCQSFIKLLVITAVIASCSCNEYDDNIVFTVYSPKYVKDALKYLNLIFYIQIIRQFSNLQMEFRGKPYLTGM